MWKYFVLLVLFVAAAGTGAAWVLASRAPGPAIEISGSDAIGQIGELDVAIETPGGELKSLEIALEQDDATIPIFSLAGGDASRLVREDQNTLSLTEEIGRQRYENLREGPARIVVTAVRPVLFGYRETGATAERKIEVRLRPPLLGAQSQFHYVNHGGSEMVVYRVTPADAESGVRVGDIEYPGFPASGAGIENADPALHVAFFALLWNQDLNTPIRLYARDELGNEGSASFDYRTFEKQFRASQIQLSDGFLSRVVPPILQNSTDFRVADPSDYLASYLEINGEMRRENDAFISELSKQTAPEILWRGPFKQLINTAVESGFADQRDYIYDGKVVDHQTHLGFDLASITAAPVLAANRGRILHAGWLGIYGNCVIIDHGMGLMSLYAHLSQIDVRVGDMVDTDTQLGRSGSTGLAGGDHLHFTMLLHGHAVTPIDWWSGQWVEDRIMRKIHEAGDRAGL
jgi:murein DD-endopeptidase MepM/ murein hydrolase activator NlpD